MPTRNFTTDYVSYRASLGQQEIGDFDSEEASLGASWNDVWRGLQRRIYLDVVRENFAVADSPTRSERALYPGMSLTASKADDPLFTRRGYSWTADLRAGSGSLFGSTGFARLLVAGDYIRPLSARGRLLLHAELGGMQVGEFERLVPSQRFFAGGDRSVRGYEFQSLGPRNEFGASIGGRYLAVATVELDYLFVGNYGAAIFYDAGNAANETSFRLSRGVGIGFRWRSPVGMLRIDIAKPLDDPETNFRLHLTIGASL